MLETTRDMISENQWVLSPSGGNSEPHANNERIVFQFLTFRTCFTVVESFVFKRPATFLASSSWTVLSLHVLVLNTNWRKSKKRNKSYALRKQSFKNHVPWVTHNSKIVCSCQIVSWNKRRPDDKSSAHLLLGRALHRYGPAHLGSPWNSFCRNQKKESESNPAGWRKHGGFWPTYLGHISPSPSFHW